MKNIALWFARESNNKIILITDVTSENRHEEYKCPICLSKVIPKAITLDCKTTAHFSHIDKSACSAESMIHFWAKHKLFEVGQGFKVKVNKNVFEYAIEKIEIEESFPTPFGDYFPDTVVYTTCGKRLFFEINYKNKKNIDDYIQKWSYLKSTVVEVSALDVLSAQTDGLFAIYYNGKTSTERKSKKVKAIEALNEKFVIKYDEYDKEEVIIMNEKINRISFVLIDAISYTLGEKTVDEVFDMWKHLDNDDAEFAESVLSKLKCNSIMTAIREKKSEFVLGVIKDKFRNIEGLSVDCEYIKNETDSIELKYASRCVFIKGIVSETKEYKRYVLKGFISLLKDKRKAKYFKEADSFLKEINKNNIVRYCGYDFYTYNYWGDYTIKVRSNGGFSKSYRNIEALKTDINKFTEELDVKNDVNGLNNILTEISKKHYKNSYYSISSNRFDDNCSVVKVKKCGNVIGKFYVNNKGTFMSNVDIYEKSYYKKIGNKNPYLVIFDTLLVSVNGGN